MHTRYAHWFLLAAGFLLAPVLVAAQWDGDVDDWDNYERSDYREKIEDLDNDQVDDLPIPVLVGIEVDDLTKNFGDPRGGGTRIHEGLDMVARKGTPVASPTEAVVTQIGDGSDSGLYVRTANPGEETFVYMHLDAIADDLDEGDKLDRGEIIGFVGNTGNASGGGAHLHFEIREDGEPKDPYPRLTEVFTDEEREQGLEDALDQGGDEDVIEDLSPNTPSQPQPPTTSVKPYKLNIAYGFTNDDIEELQEFLIDEHSGSAARELENTGATGFFGPLTRSALIEYQRENDLEATGVVDEDTYEAIFERQNDDNDEDVEEETVEEEENVIEEDEEAVDKEEVDDTSAGTPTFTRDLEVGIEGDDVYALQVFLNTHGYELASSGPGSPGNETTMYGGLTRAALARYQSANTISPAIGYFGPITRAHILNAL